MIHMCDSYCHVKNRGVATLVRAVAGTYVVQHLAVRPAAYPSTTDLVDRDWPAEPPYCVECGHEMLTVVERDASGRDLEEHADQSLEILEAAT